MEINEKIASNYSALTKNNKANTIKKKSSKCRIMSEKKGSKGSKKYYSIDQSKRTELISKILTDSSLTQKLFCVQKHKDRLNLSKPSSERIHSAKKICMSNRKPKRNYENL